MICCSTASRPHPWHNAPAARTEWAIGQENFAAKGLGATWASSGMRRSPKALAWPYLYPWPQRPPGLVEMAFEELARRWRPILDVFEENDCRSLLRDSSRRRPARQDDVRDVPGPRGRPRAMQPAVRSEPFRSATARLSGVCRPVSRAHQDVSREGCGVPGYGAAGCVWRIPAVDQSRGPLPLAGRRAGRLRRDLFQADAVWVRRLG